MNYIISSLKTNIKRYKIEVQHTVLKYPQNMSTGFSKDRAGTY